jgi:hypothetical protein
MHLIQNIKRKSFARKTMILLAAIMLGATVATDALAAGHVGGGGGHIGGGGFGGGHIGGGFGSGRVGGGFSSVHVGGGFAGRSLAGERMGAHAGAFMGYPGGTGFHSTRIGGNFHDGDHRLRERFAAGPYGYVPSYDDNGYSDYEYDGLGDYAGDTACFQYQQVYTTAGWQWRQVWVCN